MQKKCVRKQSPPSDTSAQEKKCGLQNLFCGLQNLFSPVAKWVNASRKKYFLSRIFSGQRLKVKG